ncbi:MAG: pentapeptide repeat-containing protein [Methyloceanibacter sp.]
MLGILFIIRTVQLSHLSTDSEHVEVLRRGPRLWNAWRRQHPTVIPNLTRISLSVSERQMGPINGGPINLASARLRRASLRFATLSGANLEEADLSSADLTDARLDGANLSNADLSEAVLDRTDFADAKLTGTNLSGANLMECRNLTQAQLAEGVGDASTVLPPHLKNPESWTANEVYPEQQPKNGQPQHLLKVTSCSTAGTMSWLIGGTRSTEVQKIK